LASAQGKENRSSSKTARLDHFAMLTQDRSPLTEVSALTSSFLPSFASNHKAREGWLAGWLA